MGCSEGHFSWPGRKIYRGTRRVHFDQPTSSDNERFRQYWVRRKVLILNCYITNPGYFILCLVAIFHLESLSWIFYIHEYDMQFRASGYWCVGNIYAPLLKLLNFSEKVGFHGQDRFRYYNNMPLTRGGWQSLWWLSSSLVLILWCWSSGDWLILDGNLSRVLVVAWSLYNDIGTQFSAWTLFTPYTVLVWV